MPSPSRQRGLNIFEFIALLGIVFGLAYGFTASIGDGAWEAILGALRSGAIAYGLWIAGMMALMAVLSLFLLYRPSFPRCRTGRCRQTDYLYLYLDSAATGRHKQLQDSLQGKIVRCRCGTLYLESDRERRFLEVREDGSLAPFMRYQPFGRWRPDRGEPPII